MDAEFKKKDILIPRLADELKKSVKESSPERVKTQWTIAGVYVPGT